MAAVSLTDAGQSLRVRPNPVPGFALNAIADWAKSQLAPGSAFSCVGLACFSAVTGAGCSHEAIVVGGRKPKEVPAFMWVNTVLRNPQTSVKGC